MRRLLVLRPEPGASATVEQARKLELDAIAVSLFEVEPIAWNAPEAGGFDGLLLTSANAIRHGGDPLLRLRGLPVYAVGETTAEASRDAGFDIAATGEAGVDRLLGSIPPGLKLLHLCGADRHEAESAPQSITAIPVYRSKEIPAPKLDDAAGNVALIHSPRAGRRFAELVKKRGSIAIAAISAAAAEAVGGGWECVAAADQPSDEALLALAARLCNKPVRR
jgi:uroporphyrinogen-III synthase